MKRKKHTQPLLIFFFLFFVALCSATLWYILRPTMVPDQKYFSDIRSEFQKMKEVYGGNVTKIADMSLWWVSADGLNIINEDSPAVVLNVFRCENDTESPSIFNDIGGSLGPSVDEIMKQYGFFLNEENSSASIDDVRFYDYVRAYEKGDVKCVFLANPDCSGYSPSEEVHYIFSFGCTNDYENNYGLQSPYLKDLGITDAIISVRKKAGDFVMLNVNYRRSGHYTIAKLVDGKWTELFSGQDIPPCDIVEKNQIPTDIVSDCVPDESQ